eukprot:CAMPEP_0176427630 /NCGR_PEP_ID=MMETSP0127-20121128/12679_1 /TAXON_ID=938130 /ORGANISM="Platyophrya macrostoma, Strain WH" /LENGTH=169 /DNA_ID=CAMNT_0017809179 /DNA_START=108 /DNA_END=614 /DNA_ORIENTATION=+
MTPNTTDEPHLKSGGIPSSKRLPNIRTQLTDYDRKVTRKLILEKPVNWYTYMFRDAKYVRRAVEQCPDVAPECRVYREDFPSPSLMSYHIAEVLYHWTLLLEHSQKGNDVSMAPREWLLARSLSGSTPEALVRSVPMNKIRVWLSEQVEGESTPPSKSKRTHRDFWDSV